MDTLPEFWITFEALRGKFHSARSHVETWFDKNWPADAPWYQRFVSTSLLRDLVSLDFDGQDAWLQYSKRHEGLSVFSVYPLADNGDPGDRRRTAKAYEDTMDNHRPGEREAMDGLSAAPPIVPGDRTETWKWVQYFTAAMLTMFGKYCPVLPHLRRYREFLNSETNFRQYRPNDWRAYFWKYHCAIRAFFSRSEATDQVQPFVDFLYRVRQGQGVSSLEVPPELWTKPEATGHRQQGGGGGGGSPPSAKKKASKEGHQGSGRNEDRTTSKLLATEWSNTIGKHLQETIGAVKQAGGKWTTNILFDKGIQEAFGDMTEGLKINALGTKAPCPRLFVYGTCKVAKCNASHQFLRDPTREQARKYTDWVISRCVAIKADPPKE